MKKKSKASKPAKKTVKKVAPKKAAPKKTVKKAAAKKPAAKKPVKKAAPKKAAPKKAPAKKASVKPVAKKTVAPKAAPKASSKVASKIPPKITPKIQKAVVTTVLPPKLGNARVASSAMPAQAAVKAPKAPQAKLAAAPTPANTRKRLNKDELKFFENLLNEKKETLLQEQSYLEDNALRLNSKEGAGDLSSHAYHLADHATETQDREQAFHLASREGKFLYYIEEALDRVRAGTFGICKKCGVLIPHARLVAVPTAKMCINCKSMQEHAVVEEATA
jgi:DnaK suppressor protein